MSEVRCRKVTKKFLLDFANKLYNPETRKYLRMCGGTLQNGPDPKDTERVMHCGLGELYFAMTGQQPRANVTRPVTEPQVVRMATENSTLAGTGKARLEATQKQIRALVQKSRLLAIEESVNALCERLELALAESVQDYTTVEEKFAAILGTIPNTNDGVCSLTGCDTAAVFRKRAKAVADVIREAAALLPR